MAESSNIELLPLHNRSKLASPVPSSTTSSVTPSSTTSPPPPPSLPLIDRPQFIVLIILYLLQGIPVGLAFGSIPFLLKSQLSYSKVAFFTLASYPYSLKLFWSPIVDAIYSRKLGKRKSWIIPIQSISGGLLIYLGNIMDNLIINPEKHLFKITINFLILILLSSTQDIAVDGWALTILSDEGLSYASTAQTIGLNTGYFISFTIFLALNSSDFINKYFRSIPLQYGWISLNNYLKFWGIIYLIITLYVYLKIKEDPKRKINITNNNTTTTNNTFHSIIKVYKLMFKILKLPSIRKFITLHLICKIGFIVNESATNLKLLEKGFPKEDLAITVLIDFPFEIIFGYYIAKFSMGGNLKPWLYAYLGRLFAAILSQFIIYSFPITNGNNTTDFKFINKSYFLLVILHHLLTSFMSTIQFVSISSFHTNISDPLIGGTYMTLLNTISNFGGQWPKFLILNMIDWFTIKNCDIGDNGDVDNCIVTRDGFYITNWICIGISIFLYFTWIKKNVGLLQKLPKNSWRVKD